MTATGNEAVTIAQAAKALDVDAQNSGATGGESVRLRQLKMLRDSLTANITARLAVVNGTTGNVDVQLDTLDSTKTSIRTAIVGKGVDVPDGTAFADYATKIGEIETGGGISSLQISYGEYSDATFYFLDGDGTVQNSSNPLSINVYIPSMLVIYASTKDPMSGMDADVSSTTGAQIIEKFYYRSGIAANLFCILSITETSASISMN